ncbi:MAG: protein TolQ [Bdellovibrionaceae bacterium]|nr:protein TolQ [Pseudobdellovibrionaceae bacterium]
MDKVAVNTSPIEAILQASFVVQLTLLVLVGLSVVCWGIAYSKWKQLKRIKITNEVFLSYFWKSDSLENLYDDLDKFRDSTLAHVFKSAYLEMKKLADSRPSENKAENAPKSSLNNIDNLERVIRKAIENEMAHMESKLTVLATTGSTGPFVGLFGTVWGIMSSFHKIGATGNASLAVVAPGISEALVATAIGLAAAIPAVVLYNHFVSTIRKEEIELNNFSADFLNIVKRNFFN